MNFLLLLLIKLPQQAYSSRCEQALVSNNAVLIDTSCMLHEPGAQVYPERLNNFLIRSKCLPHHGLHSTLGIVNNRDKKNFIGRTDLAAKLCLALV